jgi:tape measure domain-containing protein
VANDATIRVGADTSAATRALGSLQQALGALATGVVAKGFQNLADQATSLRNRLNQVSDSSEYTGFLFNKLIQTAQNARTPLAQTGDLFFRIARNTDALGISQEQALKATELVAKAISSSGISAQEAAGPLLQLGQALQSGTLQGDELRSILEGLPPVAEAIAKSLGVSIGELRRLGSEGKISSQAVIQGILAANDTIEKNFGRTVPTIADSFTRLTNATIAFVDKINSASGATTVFGKAVNYVIQFINFLGDNIEILLDIVTIVFSLWIGGRVISLLKAAGAAVIQFGNWIKSLGYIFTDMGKVVSSTFGWVVKFWKSAFSTMAKAAESNISGIHYAWRWFYVYFGTVIKSIGSLLKNLAAPLTVALAAFMDFFDPIINKARELLSYLPLIGRWFKTGVQLPESKGDPLGIDEALKSMDKFKQKGAGLNIESNAQKDFNKEMAKTIAARQLELDILGMSGSVSEEMIAAYKAQMEYINAANEKGAQVVQKDMERLMTIARQNVELEKQIRMTEEIRQRGQDTLKSIAVAADPRISQEQAYIDAKIALENYYIENSSLTHEQYQQALADLETQMAYQRYDALQEMDSQYWSNVTKSMEMYYQEMGINNQQAKEMARERVAFERKSETEKAQWAIQQGASVFDELGKHNKAAFQAAKAFNIANAIMNTYTGATKALAMYPPPFNFIAAAAVVAAGLAQVASIRSQQYSGRAIGGPVAGDTPYIVGENGPELFVPTGSGKIVPNNQMGGQPVNVNFTIVANDTRGFDQLLAERKNDIVNMVRSAIEDRGQRAPM